MERAVIYCRVSTDEEVQLNALETQIVEARNAVADQQWILVDSYVDEGRSGTTTKRRDEYNRLLEDLNEDIFDIIVVKSQDRLMRNTKEWYLFADRLVLSDKKLYFYLEAKFYTPDDALITGIKAILAEEYSRELSKKIKNAHRSRQQTGRTVLLTSNTWGYDKVGKDVIINEKEAEVVRLIYDLCICGHGSRSISKELDSRGIKSRSGGSFQEATIRRIIRNPLFKGTVVMNKRHIDFNTKKTIPVPESDWIIHEHMVPAIVSESVWRSANESMDRRLAELNGYDSGKKKIGKNPPKYILSGKIVCGECGAAFWRHYRRRKGGDRAIDWCCSEYVRRGRKKNVNTELKSGCDNIHFRQEDLLEILYMVSKEIYRDCMDDIAKAAILILRDILDKYTEDKLKELESNLHLVIDKREKLLDRMLEGIVEQELFLHRDKLFELEYRQIKEEISRLQPSDNIRKSGQDRVREIENEIRAISNSELMTARLMSHIVQICIYSNYAIIILDRFDPVRVMIKRVSYGRLEMSLCGKQ